MPSLADIQDRMDAYEGRLLKVEGTIGHAPSPLEKDEGSGLSKHIVDLIAGLTALRQSVDADRRDREKAAAATLAKLEPWSKAGWLALGAGIATVVGLAVAGAWSWVGAHFH